MDEEWCEPHYLYYKEKVAATQQIGWDDMPVCDEHAVTAKGFYEATVEHMKEKNSE